jgi:hypothetical protein
VLIFLSLLLASALHHGVEEPARRRLVRLGGGRRAAEVAPGEAPRTTAEQDGTGRWPLLLADGAASRPPVLGVGDVVVPPRPRSGAVLATHSTAAEDGRVIPAVR